MDGVILSFLSFLNKNIPSDIMIIIIAGSLFLISKFYVLPMSNEIKNIIKKIDFISKSIENIEHSCTNKCKNDFEKIIKIIEDLKHYFNEIENKNNLTKLENKNVLDQIKLKIEELSKKIEDLIEKYERNRDMSNLEKSNLNKELFAIKNEIQELKNKIEPMFYTINGLKV